MLSCFLLTGELCWVVCVVWALRLDMYGSDQDPDGSLQILGSDSTALINLTYLFNLTYLTFFPARLRDFSFKWGNFNILEELF